MNRIEEYKYWEEQSISKELNEEDDTVEEENRLKALANLTIEDMKVLMEKAVSPRGKSEWRRRIREKEEPKAMEIMRVK